MYGGNFPLYIFNIQTQAMYSIIMKKIVVIELLSFDNLGATVRARLALRQRLRFF